MLVMSIEQKQSKGEASGSKHELSRSSSVVVFSQRELADMERRVSLASQGEYSYIKASVLLKSIGLGHISAV